MRRRIGPALSVLVLSLWSGLNVLQAQPMAPDDAVPVVSVRSGDHAGFGRLVLDLPAGVSARTSSGDGRVVVMIEGGMPGPIASLRRPRNVAALKADGDRVEITNVPGATVRMSRLSSRLVIDFWDAPTKPQPATVPSPPIAVSAGPRVDPTRGRSGDARYRAAEDAMAAERTPMRNPTNSPAPERPGALAPAAPGPSSPRATMGLAAAPVPSEATVTLPFSATSGAAALRRGDAALVVFDERRPVDLAPLRHDPIFRGATVTLLPAGTLLRVPLPAGREARLKRTEAGWTVTAVDQAGPIEPGRGIARSESGRLFLPVEAPGQVVAMPDPLTGATLLVGTQRGAGHGIPVERRTPEFELLPTWHGVAVVPRSDTLVLRPQADGFAISSGTERELAIAGTDEATRAVAEAARASRRFDLAALPVEALHRRLQSAMLAAASAPTQARSARRREVAEALLALGMGAEMQAVMEVAAVDDARAAADPDMIALTAIAALLAGRPDEAVGIDDDRLTGSDEIALWRAVRAAVREQGSERAAAIFGSAMPLLLSYPAPLRDRLLPLALETMALAGQADDASKIAARLPDVAALDLARAYALEPRDPTEAMALYDRVAAGSDRRARALAARRSVELRMASGEMTPALGADALERLTFAWRGDGVELDVRLRIAALRAEASAWRAALAHLRETVDLFPEHQSRVRTMMADVFRRSLSAEGEAALAPIDLVALAEENADLMPGGPAGHLLAESLAERLMALDLPARAQAVLEKLVAETNPGAARAALGQRLAGLHLDEGRPASALAALSTTVVEGALPPALLEQRTLTFARAAAATGDLPAALNAFAELGSPASLDARAALLEHAGNWSAAAIDLSAMVAKFPGTGVLDEGQGRVVLRLGATAARAGDAALLARLRQSYAPRMPAGQREVLLVMTVAAIRDEGDLDRAAGEVRQARALPEALQTMAARPTAAAASP